MGRTIDLDLAVNALQQEMKLHPCGSGEWFVLSSCLGKLADLPSTQPEPCEDAVRREDVQSIAERSDWFESSDSFNDFMWALYELPPVTPKRKTGKWNHISDGYVDIYECDQCRETEDYERNYCSNCGAKMDGSE